MKVLNLIEYETRIFFAGEIYPEYTKHHIEYYLCDGGLLVIIDEVVSDDTKVSRFRGRLYAGPFNPLERKDQDSFFAILDNLGIKLGDWSEEERFVVTDEGENELSLLSSIPKLSTEDMSFEDARYFYHENQGKQL